MPCYPGLWQISFPGRKLLKTDGMNTVSSQSDHHSLSCITMQRAENDPDASFLFFRGKTSLFAVFAAESRSARFSGARKGSYGKLAAKYFLMLWIVKSIQSLL